MNFIIVIAVCVLIILLLGVVIYFLLKNKKQLKKEISNLTAELYKANQNSKNLAEYIKGMQDIKASEKITNDKIKEAKTDEEVINIINSIVAGNNSRV